MLANLALAFLNAALLSGVGIARRGQRVSRLEIVASILAAAVLLLAFFDFLPPMIFVAVFMTSLLLNVWVCVAQFRRKAAARSDSR